jgi:RNA polymerase sigma factor (sigma-70 family)
MGKTRFLTPQEQAEYIEKAQNGCQRAFERLLLAYKPLVVKHARRIQTTYQLDYGMIDDLVQEGMIGLTSAIEKFDPSRGAQLSTLATQHVKTACFTYLLNMKSDFKLPAGRNGKALLRYYFHLLNTYTRITGRSEEDGGYEFVSVILQKKGYNVSLKDVSRFAQTVTSTRWQVDTFQRSSSSASDDLEESMELEFSTTSHDLDVIEDQSMDCFRRDVQDIAHHCFSERDREIMLWLLLDDDNNHATKKELAERAGISIERVRQIHRSGHEIIRKELEAMGIQSAEDYLCRAAS